MRSYLYGELEDAGIDGYPIATRRGGAYLEWLYSLPR